MVDKIKPLKLENPSNGGTEIDIFPTEANPAEDYVAAKGVAFENSDSFLMEKLGRILVNKEPDSSVAVTYLVNGEIDYVEYFNSPTQIQANRIARTEFAYSGVDPQTEIWKLYDSDGSTILRTITVTYTYSGSDIQSAAMVTT